MENKNRQVRKDAFTGLYHTYAAFKNTLAAAYSANVKKELFYTKARKYASTMEAHLDTHNIPTAVYTQLIDTVHAFLPAIVPLCGPPEKASRRERTAYVRRLYADCR